MAETSGHGTGKSAMGAWLAGWILSTIGIAAFTGIVKDKDD